MIRQKVIFCSTFEFEWLGYSYNNDAEVGGKRVLVVFGRGRETEKECCQHVRRMLFYERKRRVII
ncbi:hypothetical protein [Bacteroides sp.]|uniref:hypothetical protein n=1 Tax=Bacteroides sp. TaxID=29523 RepID=UPI0025C09BF9|nr:hypothetical protein [Bacteroides sp.]